MTASGVDPKDLPAVALQLIQTIDELTKSIQELLHRTTRSEEQIARSERQTRWQWVVIAAIAILFTIQGFTTYQQIQTNQALIETSNSVVLTRAEMCTMYSVFLGSYNPSSRAEGVDRATYEGAYASFRAGYKRLACTAPLVPPPTSRATPAPTPPK